MINTPITPATNGGAGGLFPQVGGAMGAPVFTGPTSHFASSWTAGGGAGAAASSSGFTPSGNAFGASASEAFLLPTAADGAAVGGGSQLAAATAAAQLRDAVTVRLGHSASVVAATTVGCGLVVAAATVGSLSVVCAPFAAKQQVPVHFNPRSAAIQTVLLPDAPTSITLFPLVAPPPSIAGTTTTGAAAAAASSSSENGNDGGGSLAFELCCAVGTLAGNIHLFRVSSRSGTPAGLAVSQPGVCICERALRQQRDGSFAPGVHRSDAAIVGLASSYSPGLHLALLAIATQFGVCFASVRKQPLQQQQQQQDSAASAAPVSGGSCDFDLRTVETLSRAPTLHGSVIGVRAVDEDAAAAGSALRSTNSLTFAVFYDDSSVVMSEMRYVAHPSQRDPQVVCSSTVVVPPRPEAAAAGGGASIVAGDVFVSANRDVAHYAIEEGGGTAFSFVSANGGNDSNQTRPISSGVNNNNQQQAQQQQHQLRQPTMTMMASTTSVLMSQPQPTGASAAGGVRIGVPPLNNIRCVRSPFQAVASCRGALLMLSAGGNTGASGAANNNNRGSGVSANGGSGANNGGGGGGRYNTRSLASFPVVINDFAVVASCSSGSAATGGIGGNNSTLGATVAIVAGDRALTLVVVPTD